MDVSCPDFFRPPGATRPDDMCLMCISHVLGLRYYLGAWDGAVFRPRAHRWLNWPGGTMFASESADDGRRRVMWAWVLETDGEWDADHRDHARAWGGVLSLPRELSLSPDGSALLVRPAVELRRLRRRATRPLRRRAIVPGAPADAGLAAAGVPADACELVFSLRRGNATAAGAEVLRAGGGAEATRVGYDWARGVLFVDYARSTLDAALRARARATVMWLGDGEPPPHRERAQEAPYRPPAGAAVSLRVFVDRSVVEVFADGGARSMVQRVYPTRPASGAALFAAGGVAELVPGARASGVPAAGVGRTHTIPPEVCERKWGALRAARYAPIPDVHPYIRYTRRPLQVMAGASAAAAGARGAAEAEAHMRAGRREDAVAARAG
eukprot:gene12951-4842_t